MTPKMLFEELFNLENFKNVLETSEKAHRKSLKNIIVDVNKTRRTQDAWFSKFSILVFISRLNLKEKIQHIFSSNEIAAGNFIIQKFI